jgi:hypothetical protein
MATTIPRLQDLQKFTQIGIFGLKIYVPSGNTACTVKTDISKLKTRTGDERIIIQPMKLKFQTFKSFDFFGSCIVIEHGGQMRRFFVSWICVFSV